MQTIINKELQLQNEPDEGKQVKIKIEHLDFSYSESNLSGTQIISGLNMDVFDQEFLTIVGASGCGKSTLLNIIAGLLPPGNGKVFIDNREIERPGSERAMVFQDDAVFPWFTVYENIEYGLRIAKMAKSQREFEVQRMLNTGGFNRF